MVDSQTPSLKQTPKQTVPSEIVAVTVYSDKALVTRRGAITLTGTERELIINRLPDTIETESVRVRGAGNVSVKLLGISTERVLSSEPVAARVSQLNQQIQQLEAEKRSIQPQIEALALQSSFIQGLREKTEEQFSISLARKNLSLSETLDFLNFIGSQYAEYSIAAEDYKNQQRELDKEIQALKKQLQVVQTPHPQEHYSLVVAIEATSTGEFELEVSYLVNRASWKPLYDLRVNTANNSVNLGYVGEVSQTTGEDWTNIALTLSTAKPGLGTLPPKLRPWYIDVPQFFSGRARSASMAMVAPSGGTMSDDSADAEEVKEFAKEAEVITAEVSKEGNTVTFKISNRGNIPSDGSPHKNTILYDDFPCNFEYIAMPSLVSFAYLQALVKNPTDGVTLLPGKANIFHNDIFVGSSNLDNIAPGQEFKLNLGIDEGLKIERELVERQVDKKLLGNNRKIIFAYRLLITNLLNQKAKLKLNEQLPVSRNEQIKVRLNRIDPQIVLGEMGLLEWDLSLAAQGKLEVYYQFTVEHPPQLTVAGLDI
ncbi:MAG: mucoidy inhibitor MuiA family protein [Scytonematopsis contorta HA4267-MV1]|nr:mucoidy inhibitor MuiA family protein [Scytonematopsis contorta HA4267-MV1]